MGAMALLARSSFRGRWRAQVVISVVLAIGLGASLGALTIAWRTDHAYGDYLRRADVADVVVNPIVWTDHLLDVVRALPGVERVTQSSFITATAGPQLDAADQGTALLGSADRRFIDVDRPVVEEGRLATGEGELFINERAAKKFGLRIGDHVPLTFLPTVPSGEPTDGLRPIGAHDTTVVGIGVFSDDVLPDDLYAAATLVLDPVLSARYGCVPRQPPPDDSLQFADLMPFFFPADCSNDATLLSIELTGGAAGVPALLAAMDAAFAENNAQLPAVMRQANFVSTVTPTVTADAAERVARSVEPVVTALRLLGVVALVATVVLVGIVVHRTARDTDPVAKVWNELGVAPRVQVIAVCLPTLIALVVGAALGVLGALCVSGIGAVASVHVLDPSPALGLPAALVAATVPVALLALVAVLVSTALQAARRGVDRPRTPTRRVGRVAATAARTGSVSLTLGVDAAVRGRDRTGSIAAIGTTAIAIAFATAAALYSTNLGALVETPRAYGWPFDVGVVINSGYDGADESALEASLSRPAVQSWGLAASSFSATVAGTKLPMLADIRGFVDTGIPVVSGRVPRADHEIALGTASAERLDVAVGERVMVATDLGQRDAVVTGLVVMPAVSAYQKDRPGMGAGLLMSQPMFSALVDVAKAAAGPGEEDGFANLGGLAVIDLVPGTDRAAFVASLGPAPVSWDERGNMPMIHTDPVRPAQIADLSSARNAPALLVVVCGATAVIGLLAGLGRALRNRRRELAVVRALGCRGRQVYATFAAQALTIAAIGTVLGVPVGLFAGVSFWRRFATNLGVIPRVTIPWLLIGAVVASTGLAAIVAALPAGRRAARLHPASELRET